MHNGSYSFAYFFWILNTIKMKFGQILVHLLTKFLTCFWLNAGNWKLVPGPFMILMKWQYNKICQFLVVDVYHFQFSLIHPFKKMKHWNLDITGYWVIGAVCYNEKGLELSTSPPIFQKISEKYCPCLYLSIDQVWWVTELWFKRYI